MSDFDEIKYDFFNGSSFEYYFGDDGLLINLSNGGDTGDSAQMQGLYRFGRFLAKQGDFEREQAKFEQELDILTYIELVKDKENTIIKSVPHPGIYVRHPGPTKPAWAANPNCFSRDQQTSITIAMGALKRKKKLWQLFWQHLKRGGFYQNNQEIDGKRIIPDFAAPDILGIYIRAFYMAGFKFLGLLYPVLLLTDLVAFIGLLVNFYKWKDPNEADDDNFIMEVMQAKKALPTPISFIIRKLFKWFRPGGYDHGMKLKHRNETGSPPFNQLWEPILEKEL